MFAWLVTSGGIHWAIGFQLVVALVVFLGLTRLASRLPTQWHNLAALCTLLLLVAFIKFGWDQLWLTRLLPVPNLIVLGNAFPALTALLAAIVWQRLAEHPGRRRIAMGLLALTACISVVKPMWGETPRCGHAWTADGICLQTTDATCSAACAATLLAAHGIPATEQEMAELCLTRAGTTWMGLYRGLKLKTAGTDWDVEVAELTPGELLALPPGPVILRVGLDQRKGPHAQLAADMGWREGLGHSVTFHGVAPGGYLQIGDPTPTIRRELWDSDELRAVWRGQTVRLVPRAR